MRRWSIALAAVFLLAGGRPAFAQADPRITVVVEPIPASVTLSRDDLVTRAGYKVNFNNGTTNTLNRLSFNATITNVGTTEAVVLDSNIPAAAQCATSPGATSNSAVVRCTGIGSVSPGGTFAFYLVVKAPKAGSLITITNVSGGGEEGNGNGNGCCDSPADSVQTALIDPTIGVTYTFNLDSFVPTNGGTFYTGKSGAATASDVWTTKVTVKPMSAQAQTTIKILEELSQQSCQPYVTAGGCHSTQLTMLGTFPESLSIRFILDSKFYNLNPASSAKLYYTGSATCTPESTPENCIAFNYPIQLNLCTADVSTYGSAPKAGRPCLSEAPRKLGSQDPLVKADKNLLNDLHFLVEAFDNGRYAN